MKGLLGNLGNYVTKNGFSAVCTENFGASFRAKPPKPRPRVQTFQIFAKEFMKPEPYTGRTSGAASTLNPKTPKPLNR